jgi:hypothetical protein
VGFDVICAHESHIQVTFDVIGASSALVQAGSDVICAHGDHMQVGFDVIGGVRVQVGFESKQLT